MNKELSSGAIIYRKENGKPYFLIIYSERNKIWCFPKGHIESGEDEGYAAIREIEEETGIKDMVFVNGFRVEDVYSAKSSRGPYDGTVIEKHSIYFLCETKTKKVMVDSQEISDYKWVSFDDAVKLLRFDSMKIVLGKARERIGLIPKN